MTIKHIGIVGAGTMGAGIMINCLTAGLSVTLIDRDEAVLDKARAKLDRYLGRQVEKGRMEASAVASITERLTTATDTSSLADCDLVVEAVFENLDLKKTIFREIESHVPASTILASNTSCLRLADIAAALEHPGRFCGLHYFSPAEINPVVELIEGPTTEPGILEAATAFLKATGKEVIACKDQNGFALNRFFCPYSNEAVRLLDEGLATTAQIDEAARKALGVALGPFAVMNIIGTATNLNAVRNLSALGPFYAPAQGLIDKGANNTPWDIDADPAAVPAETAGILEERLVGSVILPVTELLAEGTASLEAVDKGARLAFRFTRTPGEMLEELGEDNVGKLVERMRQIA